MPKKNIFSQKELVNVKYMSSLYSKVSQYANTEVFRNVKSLHIPVTEKHWSEGNVGGIPM